VRQAVAMANFFRTQDTFLKLRNVTNRVMMLHGVEDVLVPVKNAPVAARRVVGSWMVTIPYGGHGVIFQNVQAAIL
jgi:pimeloyl-ACP methyl ester carboxylesterase